MKPQVLIEDYSDNKCLNCDGRGFFIIPHSSPEGHIEPNEVLECENCNGTGKK